MYSDIVGFDKGRPYVSPTIAGPSSAPMISPSAEAIRAFRPAADGGVMDGKIFPSAMHG
jgi:hypothetical protein